MSAVVDSGTLGIKAVSTVRLPRVAFALGAKHVGTDTHGWHIFDFGCARVPVPVRGNGEIGRSHLSTIIRRIREAGVPPIVLRAAFYDVGCVWYEDPPPEDLAEGRRLLRQARRKGVVPTVQTITAKPAEPAKAPPQKEVPPKVEYGNGYWSGIEDLREAVVMGLPDEDDVALIHSASKTTGRLIAQGKGFVQPLLEGHQIERYNIGTEKTPNYRYRMTELAVTQIAEYAHRKWIEKHGADEVPEPEPATPEPSLTYNRDENRPEPAEMDEVVGEQIVAARNRRFIGSVSTAVESIHDHLGVMPRFRGGDVGLALDVDAYLIAIAKELEKRGSE